LMAFAGKDGPSWFVVARHGDREIQANVKTRREAWKQICRQAEDLGLVHPL
jgi:hypothetical protein